jgi:hypothetical protein
MLVVNDDSFERVTRELSDPGMAVRLRGVAKLRAPGASSAR